MVKTRKEIDKKDKWDIEKIFATQIEWENSYTQLKKDNFEDLLSYRDKLDSSAEILTACVEKYFSTVREIEKLYIYAHLHLDQNMLEESAKHIFGLITFLYNDFSTKNILDRTGDFKNPFR